MAPRSTSPSRASSCSAPEAQMAKPAEQPRPKIVVAANDCWNIVNYRAGLIRSLQGAGYDVAVLAPDGPHCAAIRAMGVEFHPVSMQARGKSPAADLRLLVEFRRRLKAIRPAAFLGFTAKPNIYGSMAARSLGDSGDQQHQRAGLGVRAPGVRSGTWWSGSTALALRRSATVFFQNRDDLELFVVRRDRVARAGRAASGLRSRSRALHASYKTGRGSGDLPARCAAPLGQGGRRIRRGRPAPSPRLSRRAVPDPRHRRAQERRPPCPCRSCRNGRARASSTIWVRPTTSVRRWPRRIASSCRPITARASRGCCWKRRRWAFR